LSSKSKTNSMKKQKNMEQTKDIKTILGEVGLDWTVSKHKIFTESGVEIPDFRAILRDDIQRPLSVMGAKYQPYQNEELLTLLETVSRKTGLSIDNGGMFGNGEKVYIQLKTNDLKMPKGDRVEGYITGINSFDGSTSLGFGNSSVTISCQNTFFAAYREVDSKVRHTENMGIKVDLICKRLDTLVQEEVKLFDRIKRMSEVKMDDKVKDLVMRALFDVQDQLDLKSEDISTRKRNDISRFEIDLNGEIREKGDNLWGLFSGVTKFTTHTVSKGEDSTEKKLFGVYGRREREIFNTLTSVLS
jgi:phage/plasmid-like protein (TIGR03299 family)